jgi:hypothetical protein
MSANIQIGVSKHQARLRASMKSVAYKRPLKVSVNDADVAKGCTVPDAQAGADI